MIRSSQFRPFILTALVLIAFAGLHAEESRLVVESRALLEELNEDRAEIAELAEQSEQASGEDALLLERRRLDKSVGALAKLDSIVQNVVRLEKQGADAAEFRKAAEDLLTTIAPIVRRRVEKLHADISALVARREGLAGEELIRLEDDLAAENHTLDVILNAGLDNMQHMESLGLDATDEEAYLAGTFRDRVGMASARIELSVERIASLQGRLAEKPDDAELTVELSAEEAKLERSIATVSTTIEMMERLGLDTAEYEQLLIRVTGQITSDILDAKVALGLFSQWIDSFKSWIVDNGPGLFFNVLVFLLIMVVFNVLARVTRRVVARAVSTSKLHFSQLLQKMFISSSGNAVLLAGFLVALSQLGFQLGPVVAGLGIAGFIVGFALQDTLGHFAAGMMILVYRPFDVGDMIEAATVFGKVSAMNIVSTTILTIDNQTLVVPNGRIWGDVIKNVTKQAERRVDMVFGIGYGDDIPKTEKVLDEIVKAHPKVISDPEPVIKLHTLGESSVDFIVRPWCKTEDYWDVYWDITREVKMRFDAEGISIPFPQRDVHLYPKAAVANSAGAE